MCIYLFSLAWDFSKPSAPSFQHRSKQISTVRHNLKIDHNGWLPHTCKPVTPNKIQVSFGHAFIRMWAWTFGKSSLEYACVCLLIAMIFLTTNCPFRLPVSGLSPHSSLIARCCHDICDNNGVPKSVVRVMCDVHQGKFIPRVHFCIQFVCIASNS
jgi:hypothetical protein